MTPFYPDSIKTLLISLFLLAGLCTRAQQKAPSPVLFIPKTTINHATEGCGTDLLLAEWRKNPAYRAREEAMNRQILIASRTMGDSSFLLPVVFHIINPNPASITDVQVIAALQDLNDAFGKKGAYAASAGADTKIQFCLAQKDPDGGTTTGITRTTSFRGTNLDPVIEDDKLKALNDWDPSRYINIWIISSINTENLPSFRCGVWTRLGEGGYATLPPGGGPTDGIVYSGIAPGPGLAHEMGHYLGLYHTFEGQNCINNNCATDGDRVCDTPPDASTGDSPACNLPDNSCTTDTLSGFATDMPDLISDIMDYGNYGCHIEFTEGQAQRMRAAITTQRSGLLQNECDKPCAESSIAGFTRDNASPLPGDLVNFTNTSTGAGNYSWQVDGVEMATSSNFSYSFAAAGKYKVTLKAYNADAGCFSSYTDFIIVTCGVQARFYTDKRTIASKAGLYTDSISFTNTSVNGVTYQWLLSFNGGAEQLMSTALNYKYVFPAPGNYTMRLIATNGGCSDTTEFYSIPVADPTQDGVLFFNDIECYQQTKIRVTLQVCNYGYAPIPAGMPISFYDGDPRTGNANKLTPTFYLPVSIPGNCCANSYTFILNVGTPGLNQLFGVFNDSGLVKPLKLPGTGMQETNYFNNIAFTSNFQFHVSVAPPTATLQPYDTLQLSGYAGPGNVTSYTWSSPQDINCTNCANPRFIAENKIYTITKKLVATSQYGCVDSAVSVISIPPADDYTITIDTLDCAGKDSLHASFTICNNFKKGTIPAGLKVSFYDADPTLAGANLLGPVFTSATGSAGLCASYKCFFKRTHTGKVFAVVNDNGATIPLLLPNDSTFLEKNYFNNSTSFLYTPLTVTITPPAATLQPGDTLQLSAQTSTGIIASYLWSTAQYLSCTACDSTVFIAAKKDIDKQVIATNIYGCSDTAVINIKIPPADDYTISIDSINCSRNDSLLIGFTLCNSFKRGIIPQGLNVSFYDADPTNSGAHLLGPVFTVPADDPVKCASFVCTVKGIPAGNVYAVVNSSASAPVQLPQDTINLEKDYTNNIITYAYQPATVSLQPADTTIFRKQTIPVSILSPVYDAGSITWFAGSGYSLSCTGCLSPLVTVTAGSQVTMQMANRYGCLIKGTANIKVFPPDMTVRILSTSCNTNSTTLVSFGLCMNNFYDTLYAGIPVSFYDGDPSAGNARLLKPVFYTSGILPSDCDTFTCIVNSPVATSQLYAVVNDKGDNAALVPDKAFDETDYTNNADKTIYTPFAASVSPADTTIFRLTGLQLLGTVTGGQLGAFWWEPSAFLSCTNCVAPVVTPPYSVKYAFIAENEHACFDTAWVDIKTFAGGLVDIPNAFSPNADGHNDVFYVMGSRDIKLLKDFSIFNRWGQKVFQVSNVPANDPAYGWNGKLPNGQAAADGTYVYYVSIEFGDGHKQVVKGTVTMLH